VRDELFQRALADPKIHQVAFTAGGNGAGKTRGALSADVVMDTTLSNPDHSERLVQAALDAGKQVAVVYTYRPILDAMNGVLDRSKTEGRTVSISSMIKNHEGSARTVAALHDKYGNNPNVTFDFVDNSGPSSETSDIALTRRESYASKRGQLEQLLESRRTELPESVYEATKGSGTGSVGSQARSTGLRQPEQGAGREGSPEGEVAEQNRPAPASTALEPTAKREASPGQTPDLTRPKHNPESGSAPILMHLPEFIASKFKDDGPKVNYSGLGAFKRTMLPGQNLAQVEQASRAVFEAALPAITSTILQSAVPAIQKALVGSNHSWEEQQLYYVESRLRGMREFWSDFAAQADAMTPDEMGKALQPNPDGSRSQFLFFLDQIEGKGGMPQNLSGQ
jgi:hypothetical protein